MRALAVALLVVVGCGETRVEDPPVDVPPAALLGYRALLTLPDGAFLPVFDLERPPAIRLEGEAPAGWQLVAVDHAGTTVRLEQQRLERDGGTVIESSTVPRELASGPGELRLVTPQQAVLHRWPVEWRRPPSELAIVRFVAGLRQRGHLPLAWAVVRAALPHADARCRPWLPVEEARIWQTLGDSERASAAWSTAAEVALDAGMPTEATRRWRAAAHHCREAWRFLEAQRLLDRAVALDERTGDRLGLVRGDYQRGLLRWRLGDYRQALVLLERSRRVAWENGLDADWQMAVEMLADIRQDLGQHAEALALLDRLQEHLAGRPIRPDARLRLQNNRAWILMRSMIEGGRPADWALPRALLEGVLDEVEGIGAPEIHTDALANLALLELRAGRHARARHWVERTRERRQANQEKGHVVSFLTRIEGELLLAENRPREALRVFGALAAQSGAHLGGPEGEIGWRAAHGRGRAALLLGDEDAALDAFREALAIQQRLGLRTELQQSRAPFFADGREVVEDTIALLLDRGDVPAAFAVASAAEARVLRGLEASMRVARLPAERRRDWDRRASDYLRRRQEIEALRRDGWKVPPPERPAYEARLERDLRALSRAFDEAYTVLDAEVPEPFVGAIDASALQEALAPGEALVAFTQVRGAWHGFWVDRSGPVGHEIVPPETPLLPWAEELAKTNHLYVVAGGLAQAGALGAETDPDGVPLLVRRSLSYLPHPGFLLRPVAPAEAPPVVVADPRNDLPHTIREGTEVAERLAGARLLVGDEATRAAVLAALDGAAVFHFAGHGVLRAGAPWDAHLRLAAGETLSVSDLLIARPRAGVVVLSGCETGRSADLSRREALGLPAAFLATGTRAVVASDRPLRDGAVRQFMHTFYENGGATRPGEALRAASLAAREAGSELWDAFRLIGRP